MVGTLGSQPRVSSVSCQSYNKEGTTGGGLVLYTLFAVPKKIMLSLILALDICMFYRNLTLNLKDQCPQQGTDSFAAIFISCVSYNIDA